MDYRERWELRHYLIAQLLEQRIRLFHAGLILLLLVFLINFFYLQGVRGDDYDSLAENNRLRRVAMPPTRGEIIDRNQDVIASTRPSLTLLLQREGVSDLDLRAQLGRLAPILGVTPDELYERLDEMEDRPEFEPLVVDDDLHFEQLARIEARREMFPSVQIEQSARRHYPAGELFAHALGFVGQVDTRQLASQGDSGDLVSGDIVGRSGVERTYDRRVRGSRGWKLVSVNNLGRQMGDAGIGSPPRHGGACDCPSIRGCRRRCGKGWATRSEPASSSIPGPVRCWPWSRHPVSTPTCSPTGSRSPTGRGSKATRYGRCSTG